MNGVSSLTGQPLAGIEHVRQSIRDILTIRIGTRVMCRNYGSRLPDLVDAPTNAHLAMDLYAATAEALNKWEPRFRLSRVQMLEADPGHVLLSVEGVYLADGKALNAEVQI